MSAGLFDRVAEALEERTPLSRLEARGTLRIALKKGGLDDRSVSREQMAVALKALLPQELASRSVDEPETVCDAIRALLPQMPEGDEAAESPEQVFARLAG